MFASNDFRESRREPRPEGSGAAPAPRLPQSIYRYVLDVSGPHQILLLLLTVGVFLLEVVPLELQRRAVNDLTKHREFGAILLLCGAYLGVALLQGGIKLVLNIYRNWVGERVSRDLRHRVRRLVSSPAPAASGSTAQGIQASMIVSEVDPVGGFIGSSISEPLLQGGVLLTVLAYMVHVDTIMAGLVFALFLPQFVFVPLMQGAINRRAAARVQLLRHLSVSVVESGSGEDRAAATDAQRVDQVFQLNMGIFKLKFSMNFLMNLSTQLQIVAALLAGGWAVYMERLEVGGVVAFISGIGRLTDPWGDLVTYFRDVNVTQVKFHLLRDAVTEQERGSAPR